MKVLKFFGRLLLYLLLTVVGATIRLISTLIETITSLLGVFSYALALLMTLSGLILLVMWTDGMVEGKLVLFVWVFIGLMGCWWMIGLKFGDWVGNIAEMIMDARPEIIPSKEDYTLEEKIAAKKNNSIEKEKVAKSDSTEELVKFKKLYDDGVITEEEFTLKKKQILGI